eukprot:gene13825-19742_t
MAGKVTKLGSRISDVIEVVMEGVETVVDTAKAAAAVAEQVVEDVGGAKEFVEDAKELVEDVVEDAQEFVEDAKEYIQNLVDSDRDGGAEAAAGLTTYESAVEAAVSALVEAADGLDEVAASVAKLDERAAGLNEAGVAAEVGAEAVTEAADGLVYDAGGDDAAGGVPVGALGRSLDQVPGDASFLGSMTNSSLEDLVNESDPLLLEAVNGSLADLVNMSLLEGMNKTLMKGINTTLMEGINSTLMEAVSDPATREALASCMIGAIDRETAEPEVDAQAKYTAMALGYAQVGAIWLCKAGYTTLMSIFAWYPTAHNGAQGDSDFCAFCEAWSTADHSGRWVRYNTDTSIVDGVKVTKPKADRLAELVKLLKDPQAELFSCDRPVVIQYMFCDMEQGS